jgi:hypothetical protein
MKKENLTSIYYTSQKGKLLKDFDKHVHKYVRNALVSYYGNELANTILMEARQEFEALIPRLPYIGGKRNSLWTSALVECTWDLALYKTLKKHGKGAEETGEICYKVCKAQLRSYPRFMLWIGGWWILRKSWWRRQAAQSQKRRYPGDWVFMFVEGDGQEFDFGVDYTECGVCKFFHDMGADEFIPFLCCCDFPLYKAMDTGLVRTMTLSEGADRCDFRFKRGREVREGWPPTFLKAARG